MILSIDLENLCWGSVSVKISKSKFYADFFILMPHVFIFFLSIPLMACIEDEVSSIQQTTYDCDQIDSIELANLQQGVCQGTRKSCTSMALSEPNYEAIVEGYEKHELSCDDVDNDCDGKIDENVCAVIPCQQNEEICDQIDNDCDRYIDENACQTCIPSAEVCDGKDNDCNGTIDDLKIRFLSCGEGACKTDAPIVCENGRLLSVCTPKDKTAELCIDQIDNDCDGQIDEAGVSVSTCPNIDMIYIPSGSFTMGSDTGLENEKPAQTKSIQQGFYISASEITVAHYQLCVDEGVCEDRSSLEDMNCTFKNEIMMGSEDLYPMNCLTWQQARQFAQWLGGDLPSETQWEYVAKNQDSNTLYPWGEQDPMCGLLNYNQCNMEPTGICMNDFSNTFLGVCDLLGNLSEWVLDEYHTSYLDSPSTDESPWCQNLDCSGDANFERVLRGGDWTESMTNHTRKSKAGDTWDIYTGFRIVLKDEP